MLANKPVKIMAVYLSPSHSLFISDLSAYLGGGLPIHMTDELIVKHVDWDSG
jgi:hypothetical protein